MKTVKEMSAITGISIRALRYYDEIGLLKPTELTEAGYRLYDNKALEKLQEIMFFRELEIPLTDIKEIMDNPDYDKEQALSAQKSLLEQKRNRLNGIIDLITDVMKGVNTMSFEAFNNEDVQKMVNHTLECMSKESLGRQIQKYGSLEKYKEHLMSGYANEQVTADLLKWYGSKEKVIEAVMQATGNPEEIKQEQEENTKSIDSLWPQKKLAIWIWHIPLLKSLQKIIKKCLRLITQGISCSIWQRNIYKAKDLRKQPTASLEKAVLNMSHTLSSIIMAYNAYKTRFHYTYPPA